jgi:hypothetical protein
VAYAQAYYIRIGVFPPVMNIFEPSKNTIIKLSKYIEFVKVTIGFSI